MSARAAVTIDMLLNSGAFETDMKRAERVVNRFKKSANDAGPAATKFSRSLKDAANSAAFLTGPLGGVASRFTLIANAAGKGKLAVFGFSAAIGVATIGIAKALKVGEEYERNQLRTQAILKATGQSAGFTADQIHEMAVSLAESTLASVSGAEQAAQKLLTFRSVAGEVFTEALKLSQDLADTGFGSLSSNVVQVGKALEDPITGLTSLKRVGVSFTQTQKDMIQNFIETNDLVGAQGVILDALRGQVEGAAVAAGSGLGGAIDLVGQRFEEFFNVLAQSGLIDAATVSLNKLAGAVDFVNRQFATDTKTQIEELIKEYAKLEEVPKIGIASPIITARMAIVNEQIRQLQEGLKDEAVAQEEAAKKAAEYQEQLKTERIDQFIQSQRKEIDATKELADAKIIEQARRMGASDAKVMELEGILKLNRAEEEAAATAKRVASQAISDAKQRARAAQQLVKDRENIIASLEKERDTFGKTSREAQIYDLILKDASPDQIALAESIDKTITALEKQKELQEQLKSALQAAQTPEQRFQTRETQIQEFVTTGTANPEQAGILTDQLQQEMEEYRAQLEEQRQFEIDSLSAGLLTEEELIMQSYERRREAILESTQITGEQRNELLSRLEQEHTDQLIDFETQRASLLLNSTGELFGGLANLAKNYAGESSAAYQVLFGITKAFAIADATLKLTSAIVGALGSGPFPANLAAMATVAAAGANLISTITSTTFQGGRAQGGPVSPKNSFLVGELGPEMFIPNTSGTIIPNDVLQGGMSAPEVNIRNINAFDPAVLDDYLGSDSGERTVLNIIQRNAGAVNAVVATS